MSLIHEALKKAYKEKTETQPPVPTTTYVPPAVMPGSKNIKNSTMTAFSLILALSILAMISLYVSMSREREHRHLAEMALAQKETKIADLNSELTVLTEKNRLVEEQSLKDKQEFLAQRDQLNQKITQLGAESSALSAQLNAKKKALGAVSYRLHQATRQA